ncbi:MAG: hypothetical protein WBQ43_22720 [Terriglobales bacterium]
MTETKAGPQTRLNPANSKQPANPTWLWSHVTAGLSPGRADECVRLYASGI